jgi:RNA polymerase sigma-70 factor (ECF subfamily)
MVRTEDEFVSEILGLEKVLRAYLHRFAPQPADLEDLLQETYSNLFRLPPQRRTEIQNTQAYAITIARNVALSGIRHRQIVAIDSLEELQHLPVDEDAAGLDDIVHSHQQLLRVAGALATLPERCRAIFTLRRVYGFSQKEIAARLSISEGVVEQQLIKGMRRCAEALSEPADDRQRSNNKRVGWMARWRRRQGVGHDR